MSSKVSGKKVTRVKSLFTIRSLLVTVSEEELAGMFADADADGAQIFNHYNLSF